jgi:hypothetical protein
LLEDYEMALLRIDLPPRPRAGFYSRIVRRELGLALLFVPRAFNNNVQDVTGIFARSLAVAVGQAFAAGELVREEFARALSDRFRIYPQRYLSDQIPPLNEAIAHAVALVDIVAGMQSDLQARDIQILDNIEADSARSDYELLQRVGDPIDWSPNGPLGPVRIQEPPVPWRESLPTPDDWVTPMYQLGKPLWTSQLSGESLSFLVDFGLGRIETNQKLVQPWIESVSTLVANASKPRVDIREAVNCCMIDP